MDRHNRGVEISLQYNTPWWISKMVGVLTLMVLMTMEHLLIQLGTESFTIELWEDPSDNYYNYITFMCTTEVVVDIVLDLMVVMIHCIMIKASQGVIDI